MPKRVSRSDEASAVVWSSDGGDRRKAGRSAARDRGPAQPSGGGSGGGRVKVRRETSGRRGKTVTTVSNVPLGDDGLRDLAGKLKKRCGVGGSAKAGVIELQGDHRETVMEVLKAEGFDAVLAGG